MRWTKDYQGYLTWALQGHILNDLWLLDVLTQEEFESLSFGKYMNKR